MLVGRSTALPHFILPLDAFLSAFSSYSCTVILYPLYSFRPVEAAPWVGSREALMFYSSNYIRASPFPKEYGDAMLYQLIDIVVRHVLTWVLTEFVLSLFSPPAPKIV